MSILLNALKKSEAQRQLGQTPGIHTPVELPAEPTLPPRPWLPLSMLALSALSIAWMVWSQYREPVTLPMSEVEVAMPLTEESGETQAARPDPSSARTPVESFQSAQQPEPETAGAPAEGLQQAEVRKQKLNESFSQFEEAEKPNTASAAAAANVTPADSRPLEEIAEALADTRQTPPQEKPVRKEPRTEPKPMEPLVPEPISFWQVPKSVREGLPEFKVSVLVYADAPEDRFLVVNGVRLVEKGELSDGCVLDEIRRDGAVFTYKKYRFLVKG